MDLPSVYQAQNVTRRGTTTYSTFVLALIVCLMVAQGLSFGQLIIYHTLLSAFCLCLLLPYFTILEEERIMSLAIYRFRPPP